MIQISRTTPPAVPGGAQEPDAPASVPDDIAAQPCEGDALARFGALHGYHAQAQQPAQAPPGGGGSPAPKPASPGADVAGVAVGGASDGPESSRLFDAGVAFYNAGRYGEALQAFDRAYELRPVGQFRGHQAACLDRLGLRQLAASRYEDYLDEVPDASDALEVRAHVSQLREDARQAAEHAFARGQDAFVRGSWREASIAFAQAYEQLPVPEFLFEQASALDRSGDRPRAIATYRLYLSLKPEAADASQVRARIEALKA